MQQDEEKKREYGNHKELPSSWQQDRRQDKDKKNTNIKVVMS